MAHFIEVPLEKEYFVWSVPELSDNDLWKVIQEFGGLGRRHLHKDLDGDHFSFSIKGKNGGYCDFAIDNSEALSPDLPEGRKQIEFFLDRLGAVPQTFFCIEMIQPIESVLLAIEFVKKFQRYFPQTVFDPCDKIEHMVIGDDIQRIGLDPSLVEQKPQSLRWGNWENW